MGYKLLWERHGLTITFLDTASGADMNRATAEYQCDDRFDLLDFVIADYSDIKGFDATVADVEGVLAADTGARLGNNKVVKAVVATDAHVVRLAQHYKSFGNYAFPVEIFDNVESARAWISTQVAVYERSGRTRREH